ncbi:MAG: hypothetical protein ACK5JF_00660 [Oscillospiraceae bacterium]
MCHGCTPPFDCVLRQAKWYAHMGGQYAAVLAKPTRKTLANVLIPLIL